MAVKEHLQLIMMMIPTLLLVGLIVIAVAFPAQSAPPLQSTAQHAPVSGSAVAVVEDAEAAQLAVVPAE
jgi:hypothetical protein